MVLNGFNQTNTIIIVDDNDFDDEISNNQFWLNMSLFKIIFKMDSSIKLERVKKYIFSDPNS